MTNWLINGERSESVPADDRGLAYGDGVFETLAVRDGAVRFADAHLRRLADGCRRLGIAFPGNDVLLSEAAELSRSHSDATLKIMLTRGSGKRGYAPDAAGQPRRLLNISNATVFPAAHYLTGIRVRWCTTPVSRNILFAGIKSLNRLEQVMARAEWSDPGIAEGLMCDDAGQVIGGTMSNLFVVSNGRLITPGLFQCGIHGTMRQRVIDLWREQGGDVAEQVLSQADVQAAEELFLTNAIIGAWPVAAIDDHSYAPGPLTRQVMAMLAAAGVSECAAGVVQ